MQINLFGGSGPTESFKRDLHLLETLDSDELTALREWFAANAASVSESDLEPLRSKLHMTPMEQSRVVTVLRFILGNWAQFDLGIGEIETDLRSLEIEPANVEKILNVLTTLESFRADARLGAIKQGYEVVGLPTIDDINIVWDIRPVFEEFAYSGYTAPDRYTNFLGHTYLLIVEIECSRSDGKNETTSFQLSENQLSNFLDALARAREQLSIIKTQIPALPKEATTK